MKKLTFNNQSITFRLISESTNLVVLGWIATFLITLSIYLFLAGLLVTSFDFNDETEKLITVKLIASGLRLYKDIFVQHGPTSYMLSHIFYKIYPSHSLAPYRLIPIALSLLATISLVISPLFSKKRTGLIAGILFLFGLSAFQVYYAFVMTMYQVYGGYFYTISLALFIIPFVFGIDLKPWHAWIAGISLSMMFFSSFSFLLTIFFSIVFCLLGFLFNPKNKNRLNPVIHFIGGGLVGIGVVALWMFLYSDFIGYFIYHIFFNIKFYGYYIAFKASSLSSPFLLINPYELNKLRINFKEPFSIFFLRLSAFSTIMLFGLTFFKLKIFGSQNYLYVLAITILICMAIFTNSRLSLDFGESTYVLTFFTLIALLTGLIIEKRNILPSSVVTILQVTITLFVLSGILVQFDKTILYGTSIKKYYTHKAELGPLDSEEMRYLRSLVTENEKIMQIPFNLNFYIWADRLPISGIFYWMPWMNDYAKANPFNGYSLNLCEQLNSDPPKAIYYDGTGIWGNSPESFMLCILDLLQKNYSRSSKSINIWFRNDVITH